MQNSNMVNVGGIDRSDIPTALASMKRALLVSEVADLLSISERLVYRLVSDRQIPGTLRIAGCIRFDPVVLSAWLRDQEEKAQ